MTCDSAKNLSNDSYQVSEASMAGDDAHRTEKTFAAHGGVASGFQIVRDPSTQLNCARGILLRVQALFRIR